MGPRLPATAVGVLAVLVQLAGAFGGRIYPNEFEAMDSLAGTPVEALSLGAGSWLKSQVRPPCCCVLLLLLHAFWGGKPSRFSFEGR